ncbi:hypothetical protein ACH492_05170 [Streptomyces sp. NPDC019443]|uniref:hypothetical protein n=1 Tax=Streptomyces sp. NPDC019443 TaxID=3365061 RepID=UPI003791314C
MIADLTQLLAHSPCDGQTWLPRRAAQALTDFTNRLAATSDAGRHAAASLKEATGAQSVTIPVYGHLLMPRPLPRPRWQSLVRQSLLMLAGDASHLIVKVGPHIARLITDILQPEDCLLYAMRHPVETVIGLATSQVDGMRPAEAVHFVETSLIHARTVLAAVSASTHVVQLEQLVSTPDTVLEEVARTAQLPGADWQGHARDTLPQDIECIPRWEHPHCRGYQDRLAALASAWNYA